MPLLLFLGLLLTGFGAYGYVGRLYVRSGGSAGEGGSVFTLAWPLFMKYAPWLLSLGLPCLAGSIVWAVVG